MLKRCRQEQRGAVMVTAAMTLTTLLLFAGLALDFGRAHLLRAQLQTAVDAASLAGALQVIPMVELSIDRWEARDEWCRDPVSKRSYLCTQWYGVSSAVVSGSHWDLVRNAGWPNAAEWQCRWPYTCGGSYRVVREWLVLPPSTVPVAESAFAMNSTWPTGMSGTRVEGLSIATDPVKTEVTSTATISTPTTFLKLVGIRSLTLHRTGSATPVRR